MIVCMKVVGGIYCWFWLCGEVVCILDGDLSWFVGVMIDIYDLVEVCQ